MPLFDAEVRGSLYRFPRTCKRYRPQKSKFHSLDSGYTVNVRDRLQVQQATAHKFLAGLRRYSHDDVKWPIITSGFYSANEISHTIKNEVLQCSTARQFEALHRDGRFSWSVSAAHDPIIDVMCSRLLDCAAATILTEPFLRLHRGTQHNKVERHCDKGHSRSISPRAAHSSACGCCSVKRSAVCRYNMDNKVLSR